MTCIYADLVVVKAYLRHHGHYLRQLNDPFLALLEAVVSWQQCVRAGFTTPVTFSDTKSVFCIIDTLYSVQDDVKYYGGHKICVTVVKRVRN